MPIIDEEVFVHCRTCGWEAATGVRRTEQELRDDPPASREVTCHRCGSTHGYEAEAFYHRTVESEKERHDVSS